MRLFERADVIGHWVEDNEKEARSFVQDFIRAYDNVAKRIGVPVLPMSKDGNSL